MLDLHAVSSGGSTGALGAIAVILLGNDGQTVAGVPLEKGAELINWGGLSTIADTINELELLSQDMVDPQNGEHFVLGAGSLIGMLSVVTSLIYAKGRRQISMNQNTGAAANMGFTVDKYGSGKVPSNPLKNRVILSQLFAGALTAVTWRAQVFAPANVPPVGKYAILGFWVNALTNYGLVRFAHANFQGKKPGLPAVDDINTAIARAVAPPNAIAIEKPGYQFLALGDCPEFDITDAGTGLSIEAAAITADTPIVTVNLCKVG